MKPEIPSGPREQIIRLYHLFLTLSSMVLLKVFRLFSSKALCHMGVKFIAPNRRDLMVSLALHYKEIIVVQNFWLAMIICINLRPEMTLIGLWWPWKMVGDSQVGRDMLHFKYGWCSTNQSWVRVWQIYYMVSKNVTQCYGWVKQWQWLTTVTPVTSFCRVIFSCLTINF